MIAPSILAADFSRLGEQVDDVLAAGARAIHVDVMDGCFVPPITMGALVVDALRERVHGAGGIIDVHLMVDRPERHIEAFAVAGADAITVHAEATAHLHRTLGLVREHGCAAGVAINPGTPIEHALAVADACDLVLCMTVNPGWGGQPFIEGSLARLVELSRRLPERITLAVDGGIDSTTASVCADAGARLLVAGSAVFGADDPARAFEELSAAIGAAAVGRRT